MRAHHPDTSETCTMDTAVRDGSQSGRELHTQCGRPARHKVAEEIETDWPAITRGAAWDSIEVAIDVARHELTTYLCCEHFAVVMGRLAARMCAAAPNDLLVEDEGS